MTDLPKQPASARPLSNRRVLIVIGLMAVLAGGVCLIVAAFGGHPAWLIAGAVATGTGLLWLLCSRFVRPEPMRAVDRRYMREFFPAMVAYVVLLMVAVALLTHFQSAVVRTALALLPVLPVGFVMRALVRRIRDGDELERRVFLEATAISSVAVGVLSFSAGLLQAAGVWPFKLGLLLVLPAWFLLWGLALAWVGRAYRRDDPDA